MKLITFILLLSATFYSHAIADPYYPGAFPDDTPLLCMKEPTSPRNTKLSYKVTVAECIQAAVAAVYEKGSTGAAQCGRCHHYFVNKVGEPVHLVKPSQTELPKAMLGYLLKRYMYMTCKPEDPRIPPVKVPADKDIPQRFQHDIDASWTMEMMDNSVNGCVRQ